MNAITEKLSGTPCYLAMRIKYNYPTCNVTRDMYYNLTKDQANAIISCLEDTQRIHAGDICTQVETPSTASGSNSTPAFGVPTPSKSAKTTRKAASSK